MKFSAVILAGGASRRMGRDKSWILFNGQTLIQRQIGLAAESGAAEIFISGRSDADYSSLGCRVLLDRQPGCGPLAGIERALAAAETELVLALAVDLPFLELSFLKSLIVRCTDLAGVVPMREAMLEPLVACYPKSAHEIALELLEKGQYAVKEFVSRCLASSLVTTFSVPAASERLFANWNSPQDC